MLAKFKRKRIYNIMCKERKQTLYIEFMGIVDFYVLLIPTMKPLN